MTYKSEQVRSIFKYCGLLGAIHDEELMDVYMMRARHYDAQHGRFISLDPIGTKFKLVICLTMSCIYISGSTMKTVQGAI